ncbi:ADP-ribosylglycohydrolase family protein [Yinghuangia soli]|uniref:ADP-ribosylglycohydrolase family protein n=1 Tax=Yinghuangia soli TaxID=2908204 RepID=A0AA41U1U7_9ACTN|nr:ADP-ribosylglycohydrolase family protein [Yinghuangia soli]MCF2529980.1 ADP-ribosylglycohydrolase family protein [Yinghuangia soli]
MREQHGGMGTEARRALAFDALAGLSTGDAFGNQAFPERVVVRGPGRPAGEWAWTDDTQMACSVLDVLLRHGTVDQADLAQRFAERAETERDYGQGALRFIARVKEGGYWREVCRELFHGVGSWGNGGAMRVAPLGAYFADDLSRAAAESAASSEVTHAHPEGVAGGIAIGVAAAYAASQRGRDKPMEADELISVAVAFTPKGDTRTGMEKSLQLLDRPAAEVAAKLGNGARISAPDTVPFALWAAATRFDDFEAAVRTCAEAGGDMDTTAAMAGGIIAAFHGTAAIPAAWAAQREPLPAWMPSA